MQRAIALVVVAFLLFMVITQPQRSADMVLVVLNFLVYLATQLVTFFLGLHG